MGKTLAEVFEHEDEVDPMDLVGIVDTETTGLDPAEHKCIEVAVVRYSLKHAAMVDAHTWLIEASGNPAEPVNHIPTPVLHDHGYAAVCAWEGVHELLTDSCAILAHHADFDRQWFPDDMPAVKAPWIDTCNGIAWPKQSKPGSSLINLALDHGLGVVDPHRALNDCLLIARLLTRCHELGHDLHELLAPGLRPSAVFQAIVSYADRDKAKQAGFHREADKRVWTRRMAIEDADKLPFEVRRIGE